VGQDEFAGIGPLVIVLHQHLQLVSEVRQDCQGNRGMKSINRIEPLPAFVLFTKHCRLLPKSPPPNTPPSGTAGSAKHSRSSPSIKLEQSKLTE
jgi:hypothetical protein